MTTRISVKPPTRQPYRALSWGTLGLALFVGYGLGALFGGWASAEGETVRVVILCLVGVPVVVGMVGMLAMRMGSVLPAVALGVTSVGGGLLIGLGAAAGADLRGQAQLDAWFGTTEAKVGLIMTVLALGLTAAVSFAGRRSETATGSSTAKDPTAPVFKVSMVLAGLPTGMQQLVGTLEAHPDRLEFHSAQLDVTLPGVCEVVGDGASEVRVRYGDDGAETAYLSATTFGTGQRIRAANEHLAETLHRMYDGANAA
jgi:hypothetical protein